MPRTMNLPGNVVVSRRILTSEALEKNGFGPTFGLFQPENSIIESVYVRVVEAPMVASGASLGFEMGTDADIDNIIDQSGDADASDNLLDAASDDPGTLPVGTIFEFKSGVDAHLGWAYTPGFATGDAATESASNISSGDTEVKFRFRLSNHAITTQGKFEVTVNFRVFE